jgi:glucosamine--fructose-6-phosphate aminotransferase (isomerizing)
MDLSDAVELCRNAHSIFFVGRGPFYPVSLEGSLKMKEISYIHAEGYAAGELKHGPFALLSRETPVVAICMPGETYGVMISNIKEMKARFGTFRCCGYFYPSARNTPIYSGTDKSCRFAASGVPYGGCFKSGC